MGNFSMAEKWKETNIWNDYTERVSTTNKLLTLSYTYLTGIITDKEIEIELKKVKNPAQS